MHKEISYAATALVLLVSIGGVFVMTGSPTGLATASFGQSDSLGSCCCEGPQGVFTVSSGKLLTETTHNTCAMACAKEGSFGTPINTIGTC
jgi:hypothetical protein